MKKIILPIWFILLSVLTSYGGKNEQEKAEEAFRSVLEGYGENAQYQMIYLNDDDIPELAVITDFAHSSGAELYAYIDGKAEQLYTLTENGYTNTQFGSWGAFYYLERQGKVEHFYDRNGGAGEFGFVCEWDGTSAEMQILYTYDTHIEFFEEGKPYEISYYIDDKSVTFEEYSKAMELLDHAEKFEYK